MTKNWWELTQESRRQICELLDSPVEKTDDMRRYMHGIIIRSHACRTRLLEMRAG